jgi:hypothetical protein
LSHPTAAAARAVALRVVEQYPALLVVGQVVRLPGLEATYAPAVRLRVGAVAPEGIDGVTVLEAEPEPLPRPSRPKAAARAPKPPRPPKPQVERVRRITQTEKALALLGRPDGISAQELFDVLELKPHTGRALLSRLRRTMTIERVEDGRYRVLG